VLLKNTVTQMVYKHAISTVVPRVPSPLGRASPEADCGFRRRPDSMIERTPSGDDPFSSGWTSGGAATPKASKSSGCSQPARESASGVIRGAATGPTGALRGFGKSRGDQACAEGAGRDACRSQPRAVPGPGAQPRKRSAACRRPPRLILDIFAQRAQSHEGKLQAKLAQLEHARRPDPRLDPLGERGGRDLAGWAIAARFDRA